MLILLHHVRHRRVRTAKITKLRLLIISVHRYQIENETESSAECAEAADRLVIHAEAKDRKAKRRMVIAAAVGTALAAGD